MVNRAEGIFEVNVEDIYISWFVNRASSSAAMSN